MNKPIKPHQSKEQEWCVCDKPKEYIKTNPIWHKACSHCNRPINIDKPHQLEEREYCKCETYKRWPSFQFNADGTKNCLECHLPIKSHQSKEQEIKYPLCPICKTPTVAGAHMTSNNKRSLYCVNGKCNYDVPFEALTTPIKLQQPREQECPEPIFITNYQDKVHHLKPHQPKIELPAELQYSSLVRDNQFLTYCINQLIRALKQLAERVEGDG